MGVGYCLGGGPLSVSSSSCVVKVGLVGLLLWGIMAGSFVEVLTFGFVAGVVHGTTLIYAAGRGSLGCIVGCVSMMASQKSMLVVTGPLV